MTILGAVGEYPLGGKEEIEVPITLLPPSIDSAEAFGAVTVGISAQTMSVPSIDSGEAFGVVTVVIPATYLPVSRIM